MNNLTKIIDEAYELYMPQVRTEITQLAEILEEYHISKLKRLDYGMTVLEIGTKFGGTFYVWNSLFNSEDDLKISIDLADGIHGGVSAEEMDRRDLWFMERFGNCHFIRGNSHDDDTLMKCAKLLCDYEIKKYPDATAIEMEELDFLFIDGDHSYEGVKNDFEFYSQFVKKGGKIVFHDVNDSQRHREREVFVSLFWNQIKHDPRFESFEINANQNWAGLGILTKL